MSSRFLGSCAAIAAAGRVRSPAATARSGTAAEPLGQTVPIAGDSPDTDLPRRRDAARRSIPRAALYDGNAPAIAAGPAASSPG